MRLLLLPMLVLLTAAGPEKSKDDAKLEGTWLVVAVEANGKAIPAEFLEKRHETLTFKDGKMTQKTAKPEENTGSYKVDSTKEPKTIDLVAESNKKKSSVGIYELRDDTLRLCLRPGGNERPKEFSAAAGSGCVLITLKRQP